MNRRVFDQTIDTLKASILDHVTVFLESQGLAFDLAGYETNASFNLDDTVREMMFFGAKAFPSSPEDDLSAPDALAA
jgi:hypothetical protein